VTRLVWYEFHADINEAITREKRIKKWERQWKLELIESFNPEWADLYDALDA
jgi:putative endonuclease